MTDFSPSEKQSGLAGLGNALRTVAAVLLMCDPRDIGVAVSDDSAASGVYEPNLYLYDNYPGGIGQSEPLYRMCGRLLREARALIERCPCEAGCPSCVGPIGEIGERGKQVALRYLAELRAA
jgi:DEAD/DEAH box helicase domain-containing protein